MFDLLEIIFLIVILVISILLFKAIRDLKSSGKIYTVKQQIYFSEQRSSSNKKNRNNKSNKNDRYYPDSAVDFEDPYELPFT